MQKNRSVYLFGLKVALMTSVWREVIKALKSMLACNMAIRNTAKAHGFRFSGFLEVIRENL